MCVMASIQILMPLTFRLSLHRTEMYGTVKGGSSVADIHCVVQTPKVRAHQSAPVPQPGYAYSLRKRASSGLQPGLRGNFKQANYER